jgi:hypothetical protein
LVCAALAAQACLEAALQAQRRRCDDLTATHDELCSAVKALSRAADVSGELDKHRCRMGEAGRLLRQARQAETELKQASKWLQDHHYRHVALTGRNATCRICWRGANGTATKPERRRATS